MEGASSGDERPRTLTARKIPVMRVSRRTEGGAPGFVASSTGHKRPKRAPLVSGVGHVFLSKDPKK